MTTSCGHWKDATLFQKGQINALHQPNKTSTKIAATTETGLRILQQITTTWKDSVESSVRMKYCQNKIWNDLEWPLTTSGIWKWLQSTEGFGEIKS